jgi:predicted O-methyltransferase YrrM
MRPSGVVTILNDIAVNHRTNIVECGGGVSTLYIARLLRERDGHLYTIEESAGWAEILSNQLARERLTDHVSVIHAPLDAVRLPDGTHRWYSPDAVSSLTSRREIDLLIVDGPVAEEDPRIRYPALPVLHRSLKAGATVVVDDIDRRGEQQIVRRWENELGLRFDRRFLNGIAVASVPASAVPADS